MTEELKHRPWKSVNDELPTDQRCVEFASHQTYGLANWSPEKGFYEVFECYGKYEEAEHHRGNDHSSNQIWNQEIMWWRDIPDWPYYGVRGVDAPLMQKYLEECK